MAKFIVEKKSGWINHEPTNQVNQENSWLGKQKLGIVEKFDNSISFLFFPFFSAEMVRCKIYSR